MKPLASVPSRATSHLRPILHVTSPPAMIEERLFQSIHVLNYIQRCREKNFCIPFLVIFTLVPEVFLDFSPYERAAKRRTRVTKRQERKTSGYLGLESQFDAFDSWRLHESEIQV